MSVKKKIENILEQQEYITVDALMSIALNDYYTSKEAVGSDFITAPEISQMFGEMVALWCLDAWQNQKGFNLTELGPGTGALIFNILRTVSKIKPEFIQSLKQIFLLEINPYLKKKQLEILAPYKDKIRYIDNIDHIPNGIVIANEFFDALPIKQYKKIQNSWYEVIVKKGLRFDISKTPISINDHPNAQDGAIIEISDQQQKLMQKLCKIKGSILIIDYGYDIEPKLRQPNQYKSTLQSVKNHQYCDVLDNLGEADLTTHVDFHSLKHIAQIQKAPYTVHSQKDFLESYGISLRLQQLLSHNPELSNILHNQYNRLIKDMGELFKVLTLKN
ncbi:hypothetical protein phytr_5470 [Candidatus Phycorickettsia trachydisci]|uniref:SAM-dependent methyltransferase n=1 Tax=Candidatus Phycorickettsia trachydisci TaxID=2115978 RepID=A0A2P1P897_9RICK|nr:SAM-dependent methyltransferase [Candidatus Phycorickettsia trachydisci]AVP87492.1 hypothetical protein phytr_5470 [Candidatus Phycorickettsia trachydisci]